MLKVFLVEDESVVREALRDNIPWQQYGYRFVGEAGDGEMALPLIRKTVPDVLITDIKMPFMDGLALSHIVKSEYPDMKIIIISGYDDFGYARQAISEGVDEYLLKPITRRSLQKALSELREKIEAEQEQKNYVKKFQTEMQQYEQYALRSFFEKVFEGKLSAQELYEEAGKQGLDINASGYNLILLGVQRVEQVGVLERLRVAAAVFPYGFELALRQRSGVGEETADHGGFAVIDVADGDDIQKLLVFPDVSCFFHYMYPPRRSVSSPPPSSASWARPLRSAMLERAPVRSSSMIS